MGIGQRISWTLALIGAGAMAAPIVAEQSFTGYGSAPATMVGGGMLGLVSFITAFMFRSRDRARERLRAGKDLLVRWSYTEDEWRPFAHVEYLRQRAEKKMLLWILGGVVAVTTVICTLIELRFGVWIACILGGTWVLCWLASRAALRPYRINEVGAPPEALISADGLLLGADFHVWRGWRNKLEEVGLDEGPPLQVMIEYSMPAGRGRRNSVTAKVPVPRGKEEEAVLLLQRLERARDGG
jgi:hypothetical protein